MAIDEPPAEKSQVSDRPSLNQIVPQFAREIAKLDPGSAAALRRGPLAGAGAAAFWKLLVNHDIGGGNEEGWAAVLQAIAVLTPKGTDPDKKSAYEPQRSMGAALQGAGVSEMRLARLLTAQGEMRRDLAVRLCRRLSATEHTRFDLRTLAWLMLFDNAAADRQIARDYYRAEAVAAKRASADSTNVQGDSINA